MENSLEILNSLEEKIISSIDLLEIAKNYCEYNFDKSQEISAMGTLLNIVLNEQRQLANCIDELM